MSILTRGAVDLYALFEWGLTINSLTPTLITYYTCNKRSPDMGYLGYNLNQLYTRLFLSAQL